MKCSLCTDSPQFICSCNSEYLCKTHLGEHLSTLGSHQYELLKPLPTSDQSSLKKILKFRLSQISQAKQKISENTKSLINSLKTYSKSSIDQLNKLSEKYCQVIQITLTSEAMREEISEYFNCVFSVNTVSVNLNETFKQAFDGIFVLDHRVFDELVLEKKIEYVKNVFGIELGEAYEVKLTNDKKFVFMCKCYADVKTNDDQLRINCKDNSVNLRIYNLETKDLEWNKPDDESKYIQEARIWFEKYPECVFKWEDPSNFTFDSKNSNNLKKVPENVRSKQKVIQNLNQNLKEPNEPPSYVNSSKPMDKAFVNNSYTTKAKTNLIAQNLNEPKSFDTAKAETSYLYPWNSKSATLIEMEKAYNLAVEANRIKNEINKNTHVESRGGGNNYGGNMPNGLEKCSIQ